MNQLTVTDDRIFSKETGFITDLAIVVKADEGKVLDCGNYDVMAFLCEHAKPINGWNMRVLRIKKENPYAAICFIEQLEKSPEECIKFIRACEAVEPLQHKQENI